MIRMVFSAAIVASAFVAVPEFPTRPLLLPSRREQRARPLPATSFRLIVAGAAVIGATRVTGIAVSPAAPALRAPRQTLGAALGFPLRE